jgi:hypothetical protein
MARQVARNALFITPYSIALCNQRLPSCLEVHPHRGVSRSFKREIDRRKLSCPLPYFPSPWIALVLNRWAAAAVAAMLTLTATILYSIPTRHIAGNVNIRVDVAMSAALDQEHSTIFRFPPLH